MTQEIWENQNRDTRKCFGKHMTKSHSLIYYVDFEKRTVYLIDLDDHKNLYGKDNRA